ncbi:UDP-glucose 4-epimerase GalE [Actinacidiphila rubida]|uniref:UDP-glucose 4-epimerase n=1 Tax=Actinacidiphila rubida TaxID=310780 RepID=A0A1H8SRF2_9ACTN|nr:UDP-glucose 4-epimerase GalE [Actinacidiphila rubida]SEO81539.1 UDP-galactose 4-epimerase [Actinacidiphila rubida]
MRRTLSTALVTGGAGFIGSHTCVELLEHGFEVIVADDYSNSSPEVFTRTQKVAGRFLGAVYRIDLRDRRALSAVFERHPVDVVVHFAAKKEIGESVRNPVTYYDVNVGGTLALLSAMEEHGVRRLVFSSSCSIYGEAERMPLTEADPARPTNPYAASKWTCEQILADVCRRSEDWSVLSLRYFNPAGAHPSGLLGEAPRGAPGNVMPYMAQVAAGRLEQLEVFGGDYATSDGTGIRDYIHVMDVAEAHRLALEHLADRTGLRVFNLGLGSGTSVLELVAAFRRASGRPIPYRIVPRRPGDVTALVADPTAVARAWGWRATRDVAAMCRDAWRFTRLNPAGYAVGR